MAKLSITSSKGKKKGIITDLKTGKVLFRIPGPALTDIKRWLRKRKIVPKGFIFPHRFNNLDLPLIDI